MLAFAGTFALVLLILIGTWVERYLFGPEATVGIRSLPGLLLGILLWAALLASLRGLVLARVRVPHVAAMVKLLSDEAPANGQIPIADMRALVEAQLGRAGALARLAWLLDAVVRGIARLVDEGLPADKAGMTGARALGMRQYRRLSAAPLGEVILAHAVQDRSENGWDQVHDGLVLLAQNSTQILGKAGRLVLAGWLVSLLIFLGLLQPLIWVGQGLVGAEAGLSLALFLALALAWGVKAAVIDPVLLGCLLQLFRAVTEDQVPNAEWRGLLAQSLPAFRKLGDVAGAWTRKRATSALADA